NKPRNLFVVMMAIFGVGILVLMFLQSPHYETRSLTAFEEDLNSNKVIKVVMHSQYIIYTQPTDGKKAREYRVDYLGGYPQDMQTNELRKKVEDYNARIRADNLNGKPFGHTIELVGVPPPSMFESLWPQLLLLVAFIVGLYFLVFRRMGQGGG